MKGLSWRQKYQPEPYFFGDKVTYKISALDLKSKEYFKSQEIVCKGFPFDSTFDELNIQS